VAESQAALLELGEGAMFRARREAGAILDRFGDLRPPAPHFDLASRA